MKLVPFLRTKWLALIFCAAVTAGAGFRAWTETPVVLSHARFQGLTRIVADTSVPLTGLDAAHIVVTRPDGRIVPEAEIRSVELSARKLSVVLSAEVFARITSRGATIATRAYGSFGASRAVEIERTGEPAANGHILGASLWTDEGWSTSRTDPEFYDPVSGQKGLYRFTDTTPNLDDESRSIAWNDGNVLRPAHRDKNMLVLFVEFSDRRASDSEDPYKAFPAYLEFLKGAVHWFAVSSYGQMRLRFTSPQNDRHLGWIMMGKKAADYPWSGRTHDMFAYIGEACQRAYDSWGVRADDYDMVLVMPARGRPGLFNGPSNINRDPGDSAQPNTNLVAYRDRDGKPHYVDTALTAGNDMYRWGYRWLIHESGHAFGFPDLYMYVPRVGGTRVGAFFYCGGWDMMGNIAGHSTDYLAWHKWKLRWIRDDQVDVVSRAGKEPTTHFLSPVETPGGTKMVVLRTGLSTAYIAEFRTRLGINALDRRGKYSGVLLYRIDAARWEASETHPTAQIISRGYYNSPEVGGSKNLTGVWRPVDNSLDGYDSPGCTWRPGDVFEDPATGVTIRIDGITHYDAADADNSPYTADDVAVVEVTKSRDAELRRKVVLSNARVNDPTRLSFDTNVELQLSIPVAGGEEGKSYTYVREESRVRPEDLMITRADGTVVPASSIRAIVVNPGGMEVTLAPGALAGAATVATRPFYYFGAGAAVPIGRARR